MSSYLFTISATAFVLGIALLVLDGRISAPGEFCIGAFYALFSSVITALLGSIVWVLECLVFGGAV